MGETTMGMLFNSGVLTGEREGALLPPREIWERKRGGVVVIECPQRIPCNPCHTSCPTGAILPFADINDTPKVDWTKCSGCSLCVSACPGLACFVIDLTFADDMALYKLPYEMLPSPSVGQKVKCLDREGKAVAEGIIEKVTQPRKDRTHVVYVSAPKELMNVFRAIRIERPQ